MVADGRITAYRFEGFAHRQVRPRRDRRLAEAVHWTGCRVVTAREEPVASNDIMGETGEPQRKIEIIPAPRPARRRRDTPTPAPAPQPTREPEREPAHR